MEGIGYGVETKDYIKPVKGSEIFAFDRFTKRYIEETWVLD